MENNKKLSIGKILLIIVLGIIILLGLFGALCGGFFIIVSLSGDMGGYTYYPLSVGSFIIGLLIIFGGYIGIKKILKSIKVNNENNSKLTNIDKYLIIIFGSIIIIGLFLGLLLFGLSTIPLYIVGLFLLVGGYIGINKILKSKKIDENKSENTEKIIEEEKNNHIEL